VRELERTQWLSREELQAMQFAGIKQVVKHAFEHVPYYRRLYQGLDVHPEDIKDLKDFQSLPFLPQEDVKNHLDTLVSPELLHKTYLSSTGGTTGQPMQFHISSSFWRWSQALAIRGEGWYGVRDFKAKFGGDLVSCGRDALVHAPRSLAISKVGYQLYRSLAGLRPQTPERSRPEAVGRETARFGGTPKTRSSPIRRGAIGF